MSSFQWKPKQFDKRGLPGVEIDAAISAGRLRQETVSSTRLPTGDQSRTTWSSGAETADEEKMATVETHCLFSPHGDAGLQQK